MRDPILPVDPLTGAFLREPTDPEPDTGPDVAIGDVFCPFSGDGRCPANPPCPTPRERACTGDEDDL